MKIKVVYILVALISALALGAASVSQLSASTVVIVKPSTMSSTGWGLIEEVPNGTGSFVNGPATPPQGTGSANMTLDATGRMLLSTLTYAGTPLVDITSLEYNTYRSSADAGNNLAISLQFDIDYDLSDANIAWQGRLVFERYQTPGIGGTIVQNTWHTWSPINGRWWATGAPGNTLCPQATPCTWTQVLSN